MELGDIVVIGGSAGSVEPLKSLVAELATVFPGSLFIVIHSSPAGSGFLPEILSRATLLGVSFAKDGEPIRAGHIYIAAPDHHLLLQPGRVGLGHGPKENGFRPAVDPLFRSAAQAYGARIVGVLLSGGLDDGTMGLQAIKRHGGVAVVQDPDEAIYPSMSRSAIANAEVDYVLPVKGIAELLIDLAGVRRNKRGAAVKKRSSRRADPAATGDLAIREGQLDGSPSAFICPECGGALWEQRNGDFLHYRCHVGHAYTAESLMAGEDQALEEAMWVALRTLEENAALRRRLARDARDRRMNEIARTYESRASNIEARAGVIREILVRDRLPARLRGYDDAGHARVLSRKTGKEKRARRRNSSAQ